MLFRKDISRACALCVHSQPISKDDMLCARYGAVRGGYSCHKFKYDPLKRSPAPKLKPRDDLDFNIEPQI